MKKQIPNILTLGNLACGVIAIILLFFPVTMKTPYVTIALLMIVAMIFDFLDGFVARLLKVSSPIGKELDSLADLVTFGVLPGMFVFYMMSSQSSLIADVLMEKSVLEGGNPILYSPLTLICFGAALLIPLLSAYRLAKFNVDERQGSVFYGLATPMHAFFWLSMFLIFIYDVLPVGGQAIGISMNEPLSAIADASTPAEIPIYFKIFRPEGLAIISLITSLLLVVDIPLMAFKFKTYAFKPNAAKYLFLISSVILLAIFFYKAVPLIFILYFIFSFIDIRLNK